MTSKFLAGMAVVVGLLACLSAYGDEDALAKLAPDRLEAVHQARLRLAAERREVERPDVERRDGSKQGALRDYRANLHVHSSLSHDSRGPIDELVAAARRAGTQILLFSENRFKPSPAPSPAAR